MKWLTFKVQKEPGFRINLIDIGFILLLSILGGYLYWRNPSSTIFWMPLYLGLSFFLFCNVFRIGNRLEPWWYIPFTLLAVYCLLTRDLKLFWILSLAILEPIKWFLIGYRIKKGPYLGIGSKS